VARQAQYQCGQAQALYQIASVLAHEEWHVRHGLDEEGAYNAQLTALTSVGAGPALFNSVMRAKLRAVSESKRRAQAGGIIARGTTPDIVDRSGAAGSLNDRRGGP
jgi:hypothetical protein